MHTFVPIVFLLVLAGCAGEVTGPEPVTLPGPGEPVLFSKHVLPIFRNSCSGTDCHMNGQVGGDLALDTWEDVMNGLPGGISQAVPFSARLSHLFQHVNSDTALGEIASPRMPLSRDPLPAEQIAVIRRWIDEGAKNDDGTVALTGANRSRLFVIARASRLLAAVDCSTNLIARYIDLGGTPLGGGTLSLIASPDGAYVYAGLAGTGVLTRYNARTLEPAGQVDVGGSPGQLAFSTDGKTIYVGNYQVNSVESSIACVDAATMGLRSHIADVGRGPYGVVPVPGGRSLVALNTLSDDISVIDLSSGSETRRIPVSAGNPLPKDSTARYGPYAGVVLPGGRTLLVTCRTSGELRAFDIETGALLDSVYLCPQPGVPVLAPGGTQVWIPNATGGAVIVIDAATRRAVKSIEGIEISPNSLAFSSDGRTAYVTCNRAAGGGHHHGGGSVPGMVYVVDVPTRTIKWTVEVGSGTEAAVVTP